MPKGFNNSTPPINAAEIERLARLADATNQRMYVNFDEAKFPGWDLYKMQECFRIAEEMIATMSPVATLELLNATNSNDLDALLDLIVEEIYHTLYGTGQYLRNNGVGSSAFGYLDKLNQSLEETLRKEDLSYFISSCLPDVEMSWHHYEWAQIEMKIPRYAVIAARDHGKSFFFSNAAIAWRLYRFKGRTGTNKVERNPRGFLFSFSINQAIDLLDVLKETIESNEILRDRLYNKNNWNKTDIICANKARLTVKGFGSSVRGAHPAWIRIDDGLKDNVIFSKSQREKSNNYLQAVIMNMIVPGGTVGLVGTPFHSEDIYADLKGKKNWKVFEYPGIFPDGRLLWADRWNFTGLMEKRESQGNLIFSREILCKPVTSDSTIFPPEVLNKAFYGMHDFTLVTHRDSYRMKFKLVVTGCDFAISGSVGADYTVFLTWGVDDLDRMWLMHCFRKRGASYTEQMAMLKFIHANFMPDVMALEQNQFQQIFVESATNEGLPVMGYQTTGRKNDLREGWAGLAIMFDHARFKIPTGDQTSKDLADMFISEFSSVAFTDKGLQATHGHDDICSATYISKEAVRAVSATGFDFAFI